MEMGIKNTDVVKNNNKKYVSNQHLGESFAVTGTAATLKTNSAVLIWYSETGYILVAVGEMIQLRVEIYKSCILYSPSGLMTTSNFQYFTSSDQHIYWELNQQSVRCTSCYYI